MVWFWVTAVWLVLALAVSLALVRAVRLADRRAARAIEQTPPVDAGRSRPRSRRD
jgi:hypothetical protein